jgi:hypothetical protein
MSSSHAPVARLLASRYLLQASIASLRAGTRAGSFSKEDSNRQNESSRDMRTLVVDPISLTSATIFHPRRRAYSRIAAVHHTACLIQKTLPHGLELALEKCRLLPNSCLRISENRR